MVKQMQQQSQELMIAMNAGNQNSGSGLLGDIVDVIKTVAPLVIAGAAG